MCRPRWSIKALRRWAAGLESHHGRLIIAGVTPRWPGSWSAAGFTDEIGADGIVPATDRVFGALDIAVGRGRGWIAGRP